MRTTYLLSKIEQNRIYLSNIFTLMAILIVSARFIQTFQLNPNHQHRILSCSYSSRSCCCCYDFGDGLVYNGYCETPFAHLPPSFLFPFLLNPRSHFSPSAFRKHCCTVLEFSFLSSSRNLFITYRRRSVSLL